MKLKSSALKSSLVRASHPAKFMRYLLALILVLTLAASFNEQASAASIWGDEARFTPGSFKPGEVLVKFREPLAGKRVNNKDIQPDRLLTNALAQSYGLNSFKATFNMPGVYQYFADSKADMQKLVTALSLDPQVEFAEPNYIYRAARGTNDPRYNETFKDNNGVDQSRQWYLKKIGIETFWDTTTGNNQVIAILDTGVNPFHEDLLGKVAQDRSYDFVNGQLPSRTQLWDDEGHGTAVAGIIAANTNNGIGIAGINWNSILLSVKVLDSNGEGTTVTVGQGIVHAADNQARLINLSLGNDQTSKILEGAVQYAQKKGVLLVAAAGNSPNAKPNFPAAFPDVIAVGATDLYDKVTSFSSYGPYVSVVAPGKDIFTTYCDFLSGGYDPASGRTTTCVNPNPSKYPGPPVLCNNKDTLSCYYSPVGTASGNVVTSRMYVYIDGTSFAAPIVTGLASLVVARRPDLANDQIKALIEASAVDIDAPGRDNRTGYGRVNAAALIQNLNGTNPFVGRGSVLQGTVTGANFADVIVNLDPPNVNQNLNGAGGFRFDGLGSGVYNLRLAIPKRGIVLGPVAVYPNGKVGNVLSVNFDVASGTIICGESTVCPGTQNPAPGQPPTIIVPPSQPLAPNSGFFGPAAPLPGSIFFPETSHNLSGGFRGYWESNGGLAVFGFPLSEEFVEVSATDGKTYTVQYFQRNRFEFHPENNNANKILLGLLGSELTVGRSFAPGAPIPNTGTTQYFSETQHTLTDRFLAYWKANGGLAIFGYPISEPLQEGGLFVQYFERNRFEYHPENAGTRFEVLLGLLGTDLARNRGYLK